MSKYRTLVLVTLLATGGIASAAPDSMPANRRNVLTFSRSIALPGVELPAGTYTFQLADPDTAANAVVVLNHDRSRVMFLGLTMHVPRPGALPADRVVTFGEAPRGQAVPIAAWYPKDELDGYAFIYPR